MDNKSHPVSDIENPPGGVLVQIVVIIELLTFGALMVTMAVYSRQYPIVFRQSCASMPVVTPFINTFLLITSGFFLTLAMLLFNNKNIRKGQNWFNLTLLAGISFLIIKTIEFFISYRSGHHFGINPYYTFYWMLTGFHYLHVWIAWILLVALKPKTYKDLQTNENLEAAATFWHFCDLIWVLLFPTVYLLYL